MWLNNHGGTENAPGLCDGSAGAMTLETTIAFGWDPDYPWYDVFGVGDAYDWAAAFAGIDTNSLLQLFPEVRVGSAGRIPPSPHP